VKAKDLFPTIFAWGVGFNGACFYRVETAKLVALTKKMVTTMEWAIALNNLVKLIDIAGFQTKWKA